MRAWQVVRAGEPSDAMTLVELPSPDPPPGRVRIRVTAAAVALPDVFMCRGIYPLTPPLPFTPGQEAVGTVLAAGEGVDIPVGTRVMGVTDFIAGSGGFAEEALLLEGSSFPAPETMDAVHAAAFFISYHTAWIGLVTRAELQPGERLLVLGGAGGGGGSGGGGGGGGGGRGGRAPPPSSSARRSVPTSWPWPAAGRRPS